MTCRLWMTAALVATLSPSIINAIPILNGRFETTTDVQALLDLALDAADMKEATDVATKQSIYEAGGPSRTTT